MAEDIVIRYRAEVDDLTKKLNLIAEEQKDIIALEKQGNEEAKKATTTQQLAAQKRLELLKKEEQALVILKKQRELAFDPKKIREFNKAIADSESNIKLLKGTATKELGGVSGALKSFASGAALALGAAFSVDAIIQFSKASVAAFIDAEKNAERLKFAITSIGGESEAVFDRLIKQSSDLQKITIFSDDSIQQAQAALSAFGLTGAEIEDLIPKLADFATVTGVDITQAAEQIGAGLEGAGREFKKYGIEVSAAASRQENLNAILEGFGKFAGSAEGATKTLAGQLEVTKNQADELQEQIGEKLAPSFVNAKVAVLEFAKGLVDAAFDLDAFFVKLLKNIGLSPTVINQAKNSYDEFTASILDQVNAVQSLNEFDELALKLRNDQTKKIAEQNDIITKLEEKKETALNREVVNLDEVRAINQAIFIQRNENLKNEINQLNIIEDILTKQRAVRENADNAIAEAEKKRIEEQKKAAEEARKLADIRIAGSAEEIKLVESLGAEYKDLLTLLQNPDIANQIKLSVTAETDPEEFKRQVADLVAKQNIEITVPLKLEVPEDLEPGEIAGLPPIEEVEDYTDQVIDLSVNLANELSSLYSTLAQNQINSIESAKDAQLEAIDRQLTANEDALSKRRISETEAAAVEKRLLAEKLKAEQEADKKIREIKRKQAIADKAAALIQITISTAEAVANALTIPIGGVALGALYAALGAAQAAIVLAQPIPYEKGTKNAEGGLSMVGEKGKEVMYVPQGTKVLPNGKTNKYAEVLDSMFDNRFEDYVLNRYVNPALQKQKAQIETTRSSSFAENIGKSIVYNQLSAKNDPALKMMLKNGIPLTNADEIGQAVARYIQQDIYRR